ncbi:formate dehydrogenase accessory protein FdhE [Chelatococcus sambhunathii]|uniref:Formate dehydrogenase accessory protein FdhE n=1 Tax=Chelatococcus sambhunathii TaxID=363953 RepID=A0ABU1DB33_9HYPH|nr:formate dehydrogenase accessory protein FdhE [Chelatococcus sambhunathii]MDR4305311.1 formate dehydrogenase accessory protein FdhE [Chelatococcus sambhunathii]
MAGPADNLPQPDAIGGVPDAPFAVAPNPESVFAARAARFRALAPGHALQDYLTFLGDLSQAQNDIQHSLPEPKLPATEALERSYEFGMPPLDRGRFETDEAALAALSRLLDHAVAITMPQPAAEARDRLAHDEARRLRILREALESASAIETLADHVFASAALQVHFARLAARIDASRLKSVGVGACPCCGGPPVASLVVGWEHAHGVRYVVCALCGTYWNHVRVKCVACDSTEGVAYRSLAVESDAAESDPSAGGKKDRSEVDVVRAETCDRCRCYVKIMQQHLVPEIDPVADDVATLGLDLKVREAGWARAAFNPYLLGY